MTCKDCGMSEKIHSQWHCSAASQSLHTTHPSKKCHPLWPLQHTPNPLPFDHYSSKTQQSHKSKYRTSLSLSLSLLLSLWLSACPLVRRIQPVPPLWADMADCPPLRRPVAATKQVIWSDRGALLFGIWSLATQLRGAKQGILTKCHLCGQSDRKSALKRERLLGLVFLRDGKGAVRGELVAPLRQSLSSLQVMDTLTTH